MQYTTILALLSAPLLTLAQQANPFSIPEEGLSAAAGEALNLEWEPTTDGTVTLVLRSGSSTDLNEGTVIASNIDNSGSYSWTPSNDLTRGSDYTIEIVDDDDPSNTNYTPYFVLDTDTTTSQQTSIVSLGQPTTTPELSTASPTGDATSLTDVLETSSASSGASDATTTTAASTTVTTGASSSGASASSSGASSASEGSASSSASATEDLNQPEQTDNAASKKTAMFGMIGAVALGAIAL